MTITLTDLLKQEVEGMYHATEGILKHVDNDKLNWKPASGKNWMTTGQLLHHLTNACGMCVKGFVSGDWGLPPGQKYEDIPHDVMMPQAEKMPAVKSVDECRKLLAEDKKVALKYIAEAGEKNLLTKTLSAPWGGPPMTLFQHISHMIGHLGQHKGQLFYYLKLQGKDMNTMTLYGGA